MVINRGHSGEDLLLAVILTDKDRKIQWTNDDFTQITGYHLKEVKGKKPSILQGQNTEPDVVQEIRRALSNILPIKTEITNYRKNGQEYLCKLVIYPLFNENEEHTHYLAFEIDGDKIKEDSDISIMQLQPRYRSSSLSNVKALDIYVRLNLLFEREKIYLDPTLKLKNLTNRLGTNTRYLSQVVNRETGNNVLYFINKYRIEEAKKKIQDPNLKHLTTYGIAQLCGFRNKSTFYKVFKEFEGLTPKDYLRELNK